MIVVALAALVFVASNFAGPSGTQIFFRPTINVLAISTIFYLIGLMAFLRREKH